MSDPEEQPEQQLDPCLVCRRRTPRAGYTCDRCLVRLRRELQDLPDLYAMAEAELRPVTGASGGRGSEPSIGLRVAALDLRQAGGVIGVLTAWAKVVREDLAPGDWVSPRDFDVRDRAEVTLVELVRFLQRHLGRFTESHPAVDDFARELAQLHAEATSAANRWPRPGWVVSCPADHGEGACGRLLRVTGEQFDASVTCRGCGTVWDVMRLLLVAATDAGAGLWLPAEEVAMLYGVAESTLRKWAKLGLVEREHGRYKASSVRAAMMANTRMRLRVVDGDGP